ncbi:hypothetical protein CDD81_7075 [Ophiocordyceps australis]|uniref:PH domain-containing protein n=1 Tax=Ophiocordyceps australis TaxID=1399860 RepID=A0A2C5Y5I8_9HYPO|nr:hypothetical protein CDD81_7075 [Ophiocordyceps australis]
MAKRRAFYQSSFPLGRRLSVFRPTRSATDPPPPPAAASVAAAAAAVAMSETAASSAQPSRATTGLTAHNSDAIPDADPSTTAGLLAERLQAWRYAVTYLVDYVTTIEKIHGRHAKEYEKALKTISNPLKDGQHFDQSLGGMAGFFENMRTNTQALINTNAETEKSIKGSVLPILERLHKEIKHKSKELASGAQSSAKEVDKLRNATQKQIELLGQQTAAYSSAGGGVGSRLSHLHHHHVSSTNGQDDPYVVYRGVMHRLAGQVVAENNHRNDLLAVQTNFETFEAHVIQVLQQAVEAFVQLAGGQGDKTRALYADMLGNIQAIPPDFEWKAFSTRSADRLVNASDPPRTVEAIAFPNMDHSSTRPLIEGSLERKSRNKLSWRWSTGYYVVTPARFLHEFKDSDDTRQEPRPELSIYLPEAIVGAPSGDHFNVKGKDRSKTISSKLTGSSELSFKAHTAADAQKWFQVIRDVCGATAPAEPASPVAESPVTEAAPPAAAAPSTAEKAEGAGEDSLVLNPPVATDSQHTVQEAGVTAAEAAPLETKA